MSRPGRLTVAATACASLAACVPQLPKFRAGAPVEPAEREVGHVYKQDGKPIDPRSLMAGLEGVEASRADAQSARGYTTTSVVLGGVGGFGIGYGLVTGLGGEDSGWRVAGLGLGITAIGIAVGVAGDHRLHRAVESYNGTLEPRDPTSSFPAIAPWIAPVPGSQARCVAGGIAVRF